MHARGAHGQRAGFAFCRMNFPVGVRSTLAPFSFLLSAFSVSALKLTRFPRSLAPTLVVLPSMSLIPFAPLSSLAARSLTAARAALPAMSLFPAPSIVFARCPLVHRCPRGLTGHVARPGSLHSSFSSLLNSSTSQHLNFYFQLSVFQLS